MSHSYQEQKTDLYPDNLTLELYLHSLCHTANKAFLQSLMEKTMATHSSTLVWKIPRAEEPGRLQSVGWLRLSDFTFTFHFQAWEKEMATHSSVLAWRIPGTGEPGGLPSMGSHRVGQTEATQQQQQQFFEMTYLLFSLFLGKFRFAEIILQLE